MKHWNQLPQWRKIQILELPEHDKIKQRYMSQILKTPPIRMPKEKVDRDSGSVTRKIKTRRQKRSRVGMPSNMVHSTITDKRDKYLYTAPKMPDLIARKKQESYDYNPQYGNTCTVDGTPLALVKDETSDHFAMRSDLHQRAEHIRQQERNHYLYGMPSSDF